MRQLNFMQAHRSADNFPQKLKRGRHMKSIGKPMRLALGFFIAMLGLASGAQMTSASHLRPTGATPVKEALVVAYKECPNDVVTLPNSTHGGTFPSAGSNDSCTPAVPASDSLEVGTPDANGAGANLIGSVTLRVQLNADPDPNDVLIDASIRDVRCQASTDPGVCNSTSPLPNVAGGQDYTGKLLVSIPTRITDHYNDDGSSNFTDSGTVSDAAFEFSFPVTAPCAPTDNALATLPGDKTGSTCAESTSMNALLPGSIQTGNRANVQIPGSVKVFDGGSDGDVSTSPNTLFLERGYFVP
jgi:hypothetical protein